MTKQEISTRIEEIGIIPAVRVSSTEDALFASDVLLQGGIPIVEITMTIPRATEVIEQLRAKSQDLIVGAGTVLDLDTARRSVAAGAMFLTSTGLDPEIVEFADKMNVPMIPGALTPSEIMTAWKAGSDFVKVFPCSANGGPRYMRDLKGPFSEVPLIASGGVNQTNAVDFIRAGAVALGIGRDLIHQDAIRRRERGWVTELARRYTKMVAEARSIQQGVL